MRRILNALQCVSAAALLCGGPAFAQTAESTPAADEGEGIVVTGSRIARRDFNAVSPIVTLGEDQIERSSQLTIEGTLNLLPQMGVGTGASTIQNRTGRASLNLRGLGEPRSLVLLDGRRIQPGEPGGAVDLTVIPGILVQSVETITGGASAAYGSDAMAGVVNLRLKKNFDGVLATGQYNLPEHPGGQSQEYNLAIGDEFDGGDGRAFMVLSYGERSFLGRRQRDFFEVSTINSRFGRLIVNNSANPPSQQAIDQVFGQYGAAPGAVNRTTTISFNDDKTMFTPAPGTGRQIINYRHGFDNQTILLNNAIQYNQGYTYSLVNPFERYSIFAHAEHKIGENINWFVEGLFTTYTNSTSTAPPSIGTAGSTINIPVTNPFIPADFRTLLNSRQNPNGTFSGVIAFERLPMGGYDSRTNVYQMTTGLDGELGLKDWSWSAYLSHGATTQMARGNQVNVRKLYDLINALDGGASRCAGGLDIFGPDAAMSQQCLDYIYYRQTSEIEINQTAAEAVLQGSLFDIWAGDVRFAAGLSYRREGYNDNVDPEASGGNLPGDLSGPSTSGERDVTELFGELAIPLITDAPLIDRLELDLGYRLSDYSTSGSVESYSSNLTWAISDFVTVRGGYSRAIRAPSLNDLYSTGSQTQLRLGTPSATTTGGDPCDVRSSFRLGANGAKLRQLCLDVGVPAPAIDSFTSNAQTIFGQTSGNLNLDPEWADTYTAGIILESPFDTPLLSHLRASIDYFDIEINDAIGQIPLTSALARCYNLDGVSNPTYSAAAEACAFFPRDVTGQMANLRVPVLNLARYQTTGVDVQVDWQVELADLGFGVGTFGINMVGTYLNSFEIQQLSTTPSLDYVGTSDSPIDPNGRASVLPHWKSVTTFSYTVGPIDASLRWRYVGQVDDVSTISNPNSTTPGADAYNSFDASLGWDLTEKTNLRFGVNNLGDVEPLLLNGVVGNTDNQSYDVIGRTYYLALRKAF
ncbi:MAG: TonB-dependent receptor [Hyphomonadaceae bacterium]|nr:TonB-dependent receptor [Hyphomonadaceae bacterium]